MTTLKFKVSELMKLFPKNLLIYGNFNSLKRYLSDTSDINIKHIGWEDYKGKDKDIYADHILIHFYSEEDRLCFQLKMT